MHVENDPTSFYSLEDFEKSTTLQKTENKEGEGQSNRGGGKGQPFGGTGSIIDCVADRLENLNEQFAGTAEKATKTSDNRGGGRPSENFAPPESDDNKMPDNFTPPENNNNRRDPKHEAFQNGKPPENVPTNEHDGKEKNNVVRVHIDGHIIAFDTSPIIENGTTLVGFRSVLEALGATVSWDEETKNVTAEKDGTVIRLTVGSDTAYVDDEAQALPAAPVIIGNSTMIPVRFISEQLGMKVSWNGETKLITVSSK